MTETPPPPCPTRWPPRVEAPDRNLALELVRVTEAAAMAAGRWVGRGDKNGADGAAVNAMRTADPHREHERRRRHRRGREGRRPDALQRRARRRRQRPGVRRRRRPDRRHPAHGARAWPTRCRCSRSSPRGTMFDPSAVFYMEKLVTGPEAADVVDIRLPVAENVRRVAKAKSESPEDVTVVILDRPAAREHRRGDPRRPAHASSSSPTATSPARSWPRARAPASTCCSASAARPRASSRPARSSASAA